MPPFRMFIVLGKVRVSLSQEAGDAITLLLYPLPLAHSSAQGYVSLVFLNWALPSWLFSSPPLPCKFPFLLCPI